MSLNDPQYPKMVSVRRSQRVCVTLDVVIAGVGPGEAPFSERTKTLIVNAHGALILLELNLDTGQLLTVQNVKTKEERACRVVFVGPVEKGKRPVGVEFLEPAPRFWRIAFPPADWSPHSEEAKKHTPQPAAKPKPVLAKK